MGHCASLSLGLWAPNVSVGPYFCMQTDAWGMIMTQNRLTIRRSRCESVCMVLCVLAQG